MSNRPEASPLAHRRDAVRTTTRAPGNAAPPHDIVELYRQHERRIHAYCLRHLRDALDAEDATQETFLRAASRLDGVSGDPAAYLSAIARNVCCDLRTARHRHDRAETTLDGVDRADTGPGPEQTTAERAILCSALHALNRRERALLVHRYAGYSYEETAARLGLTVKVVSVSIVRARQRARQVAAMGLTAVAGAVSGRLRGWVERRAAALGERLRPDGLAAAQQTMLAMGSLVLLVVMGSALAEPPARLVPASAGPASPADPPGGGASAPSVRTATRIGDPGPPGAAVHLAVPPPTPASPIALHGPALPLPWLDTDQRDVTFDSFTTSPDYASDHSIFAAGSNTARCAVAECGVVFKSQDGGRTWQRRSQLGPYNLGPIVLLPTYPTPPAIYAATPEGLQRSDTDGNQFTPVAPSVYATAAPLTDGSGHVVMLVGSADSPGATSIYDPARAALGPGPVLQDRMVAAAMAMLPGGRDVLVLAHATPSATSGTMSTPAELQRCSVDLCTRVGGTIAIPGGVDLALSPVFAVDHTLAVWSSDTVYLSGDGGSSLHIAMHVTGGEVTAVALGSGTLTVAERLTTFPSSTVSVLTSNDGGATFQAIGGSAWATVDQVNALAWLPDGHLLAGLVGSTVQTNGIRCSSDHGATWSLSC